jgi:hypothetical protein
VIAMTKVKQLFGLSPDATGLWSASELAWTLASGTA